jgi:hypothetical protein
VESVHIVPLNFDVAPKPSSRFSLVAEYVGAAGLKKSRAMWEMGGGGSIWTQLGGPSKGVSVNVESLWVG